MSFVMIAKTTNDPKVVVSRTKRTSNSGHLEVLGGRLEANLLNLIRGPALIMHYDCRVGELDMLDCCQTQMTENITCGAKPFKRRKTGLLL